MSSKNDQITSPDNQDFVVIYSSSENENDTESGEKIADQNRIVKESGKTLKKKKKGSIAINKADCAKSPSKTTGVLSFQNV